MIRPLERTCFNGTLDIQHGCGVGTGSAAIASFNTHTIFILLTLFLFLCFCFAITVKSSGIMRARVLSQHRLTPHELPAVRHSHSFRTLIEYFPVPLWRLCGYNDGPAQNIPPAIKSPAILALVSSPESSSSAINDVSLFGPKSFITTSVWPRVSYDISPIRRNRKSIQIFFSRLPNRRLRAALGIHE